MKKLLALILTLAGVACIFCGCGGEAEKDDYQDESSQVELNESSSVSESEPETVAYPTLIESTNYVKNQFPEYSSSILSLGNQVNLSSNGLSFVVFYEDNKFQKIWCKNADFSSAYNELSTFFANFAEIGITEDELKNNMEVSMEMPKYTSYTYSDDNFNYSITIGQGYAQITLEAKTSSFKLDS